MSSGDNMFTNILKIIDTTKKQFLELIFFQNDKEILQKYCPVDLRSVLDPLTCWMSTSVQTGGFLGI